MIVDLFEHYGISKEDAIEFLKWADCKLDKNACIASMLVEALELQQIRFDSVVERNQKVFERNLRLQNSLAKGLPDYLSEQIKTYIREIYEDTSVPLGLDKPIATLNIKPYIIEILHKNRIYHLNELVQELPTLQRYRRIGVKARENIREALKNAGYSENIYGLINIKQ